MNRCSALWVGVVLLTVLLWAGSGSAHRGHVTLMEAEFDAGRLEVALQVQRKDLDRALASSPPEQTWDQAVHRLIETHIQLRTKNEKVVPLEWVGVEKKGFVVWIYFQWSLKQPLMTHTLGHRLFLDIEPGTVHTVNLSAQKKQASLTFRQGETRRSLPAPR